MAPKAPKTPEDTAETPEVAPEVAAPVDENVKTTAEGTFVKDASGVVVFTRS
jgi:hypothetical protein